MIPFALLLEWYYSGKQKFGKLAFSRIINGLVYFILVYFLIKTPDDVTLVPVLYTIGVTSAVAVLGTFSISDKPFTLPSRKLKNYLDLLVNGSLIGLGDFFAKVVQLLPPILIGIFLSFKDAGIYGAAFRIIMIAMMLDRIFVNLLLPNLASLWTANKEAAIQRVNMVLKLVMVGGAVISMLTVVNAEQIISLLYGSGFIESVEILQILSGFILLTFINSLFSFGLIATNNDQKYFLATAIGGSVSAIIIVLFSTLGTPNLVAVSILISELILMLSSYFWFRKIIPVKLLRPFLIITLLIGLLFLGFEQFKVNHIIASVISIIVIPFVAWNTRIIRIGELSWVKEKLLK